MINGESICNPEQQLNANIVAAKLMGEYVRHTAIQHSETGEISGGWVFINNSDGHGLFELDIFKRERDCMRVVHALGTKLRVGIIPCAHHAESWLVTGVVDGWSNDMWYHAYEDAVAAVLLAGMGCEDGDINAYKYCVPMPQDGSGVNIALLPCLTQGKTFLIDCLDVMKDLDNSILDIKPRNCMTCGKPCPSATPYCCKRCRRNSSK